MGNAVAMVIPGKWDQDERDVRRIQWLFDVGSTLGCRENYFRCFFFSFLESDYFCSVFFWMNTLLPGIHFLPWKSFKEFSSRIFSKRNSSDSLYYLYYYLSHETFTDFDRCQKYQISIFQIFLNFRKSKFEQFQKKKEEGGSQLYPYATKNTK